MTATSNRDTGTERRDNQRDSRIGYWALLGAATFVATVTFVLSFRGLDDYGRRVAGAGPLSPLVPLGIDGLTLVAVAATFVLRHARARVRIYAWFVFAISVALSIGGNLSHAVSRHLPWDGMIGAAVWPVLLALASHLVIVARRTLDLSGAPSGGWLARWRASRRASAIVATRTAVEVPVVAAPERTNGVEPTATVAALAAPRRTPTPVKRSPKVAPRSATRQRDRAIAEYRAGRAPSAIASDLGVATRTVQRWVEGMARDTGDADSERVLVGAVA